jgi:uncharacterized delta-60 repeat protein
MDSQDQFPHRNFPRRPALAGAMAPISEHRSRRAVTAAIALATALLLLPTLVQARPGQPVRSFGQGGVAQLPDDTRLFDAAVQRDGKLVAVGERGSDAGNARLLVARFNRNGGLDTSFNPGLLSVGGGLFLGPPGSVGRAVAIRGGRIVVAGALTSGSGASNRGMLVMRLRPNGTPDTSFSRDGVATALTGRRGEARGLAFDGRRIVVAGSALKAGFPRVAVARFRPNGRPDRALGGGARVIDFGRLSYANAVAVRRDRRIVLAGQRRDDLQTTSLLVARLNKRGGRDRRFSGDGAFVRQYARGAAYSAAYDLALARRGKIVVAGAAIRAAQGSSALAVRLRANGRPDRGFGRRGAVYLRATADRDQYTSAEPFPGAQALALSRGRIVMAGHFDDHGLKRLALWALKPGGAVARGFGRGGRQITTVGHDSELAGLARARGGDLLAVGFREQIGRSPNGIAARYRGFRG